MLSYRASPLPRAVAQVLQQLFKRSPTPQLTRDFFDQTDIAEFAPHVEMRLFGRFAALDSFALGYVEMLLDFGIEFFIFALSPVSEFHASRPFPWLWNTRPRHCQPFLLP